VSEVTRARPLQAAVTSAAAFAVGAALPVAVAVVAPAEHAVSAVVAGSLVSLTALGGIGARVGGAPPLRASLRTAFFGAAALAIAIAVGKAFGVAA
jgi:VIT1/CCC1 family predicted Fe2+/Mn2+ transporter